MGIAEKYLRRNTQHVNMSVFLLDKTFMCNLTKGTIEKWSPIPRRPNERFNSEGLYDDYEGFRILLRSDAESAPMYRISFENALFYQNRDESDYLDHGELSGKFDFPHPFYKVLNSELLRKFTIESAGTWENNVIVHYAIYLCNDCIDVLSALEPEISNLNE